MQFALEFVNLSENGVLCVVSKEFREAAEGDALWREAYEKRFPKKDEERGNALQEGPDAGAGGCAGGNGDQDVVAVAAAACPLASGKESVAGVNGSFKHVYKGRIQDPHVSAVNINDWHI